jgi:hypothetical protein
VTVCQASRSYYLAALVFTTILAVTPLLHDEAVRACPNVFGPAAGQFSHLQPKET